MAYGSLKVDSLVTNTQTINIDDLSTTTATTAQINSTVATEIATAQTAWTVVNSAQTVAANTRYLVDCSAASFTLTLPASPTAGQFVEFADQKQCFATYNVTVARNGSAILGAAADLVLNVNNAVVRLIYSGDATQGWIVK